MGEAFSAAEAVRCSASETEVKFERLVPRPALEEPRDRRMILGRIRSIEPDMG